MSYSRLPIDVIHDILEDVPDFATLSAAIRISQTHHEVFQTHPKSILRAVAENVVGSALHSAARVAEYQCRCSHNQGYGTRAEIAGLPDENHFATLDFTTSPKLMPIMERNAAAVRTLRDFYSQRRKDRTSLKCVLGSEEALRFDRAMYRYWLWLDMVQENAVWKDEEPSDDDDADNDQEHEAELCDEFVATVKALSSEELLEILHVAAFATETRLWRASWTTRPASFHTSSVDPGLLAQGLMDMDVTDYLLYTAWDPIQDFIKDVLLSRNVKPDQLHDKISSAIVTTVVGAGDKCSRCQTVGGITLLGTTNMFLLSGLFPVGERISSFPGLLPRNKEEHRLIEKHILTHRALNREKTVFHEMVDLELEPREQDVPAGEQWSKDDWYCLSCIKELFQQRFLPWWKKTKQGDGSTVQEDCWYGYNCRTMTHKPTHALKLNHFCEPTRGDPPNPTPQPPINNPGFIPWP